MKNRFLFTTTVVLLALKCTSQVSFEPGYYVDNSGTKIDGLVKNLDWKDNPTDLSFKESLNSNEETLTIEDISEFGVNGKFKFVRTTVNIDRSSESISKLSKTQAPEFNKEQLFLRTLVEGKAALLFYKEKTIRRFFYSVDGDSIEQLVYKKYRTETDQVGTNEQFKRQLWLNLKCKNFTVERLENLNYTKPDLIELVLDYNNCNGSNSIEYKRPKSNSLGLSMRPGVNLSSLSIDNVSGNGNYEFDKSVNFRIGLELEYVLPYKNNKWSIILEPTYRSFNSEIETASIRYSSIEIPIGLRHYFFLDNEESRFFINACLVYDKAIDSSIDPETGSSLEIETSSNWAIGVGYEFQQKVSVELRQNSNRDVLGVYSFWDSAYKTTSLIFGYRLFN